MKLSKWFLRAGQYCGRYLTQNEKRKSSDPEIQQFIRPKRRSKNIMDCYTNTKWLKKINDKSWKTRCKKKRQYEKHKKSSYEKEILKDISEKLDEFIFKYGDGEFHTIPINSDGFFLREFHCEYGDVVCYLQQNGQIEVFFDGKQVHGHTYYYDKPIKFRILLDKIKK